jgi:acyl dehydratase
VRTVRFEDVAGLVGQDLGVSDWFVLDQGRIDRFAEATEDFQWIHVDVARATREIGGPIAHGFLTLSMMSAMTYTVMRVEGVSRGVNYGFNKVRFISPVPAGARIRCRQVLLSAEPKGEGLMLTRECTVEIEGYQKPALVAEWLGVIYTS